MSFCVVLVMIVTLSASSVTSCLAVMSLVTISLPASLVPVVVAAGGGGAVELDELETSHRSQKNNVIPYHSSYINNPSDSLYSLPPGTYASANIASSSSHRPSNSKVQRTFSTSSQGFNEQEENVEEEEEHSIGTEPEGILVSSAADDALGRHVNDSSSISIPPCIPKGALVNGSDVSTTCTPQRMNRSSQVGALMGREWVRIVGFSLIFVVGVVGNVLVVVTLLHHRNLRSLTNVFLLNLAVSDLLLGVFCMPFTLIGSLLQDFVFGALMCRLIPYMQAVSVSVSVWTLVAISLERFYAICQPLRSRRWQTASHAYKVIAGVWGASLLLMTPIAALSTLMPVRGDPGRHKCREVWASLEAERTFTILLTVFLLLVPLVVMAAAYLRVVRTLWLGPHLPGTSSKMGGSLHGGAMSEAEEDESTPSRLPSVSMRFRRGQLRVGRQASSGNLQQGAQNMDSSRGTTQATVARGETTRVSGSRMEHLYYEGDGRSRRWEAETGMRWGPLRSSQAQRSLVAKRRVVRMLFVLVAEFFICWTPLFLVNLLSLYIPRQVYAALGSFGVSLVQLLAYLSSCCNPLTYCFMNAKFIQSFKLAFACTRRRPSNSLHGVAVVSSFHTMPVSYRHNPASRLSRPGFASSCTNGATHDTGLQGTGV